MGIALQYSTRGALPFRDIHTGVAERKEQRDGTLLNFRSEGSPEIRGRNSGLAKTRSRTSFPVGASEGAFASLRQRRCRSRQSSNPLAPRERAFRVAAADAATANLERTYRNGYYGVIYFCLHQASPVLGDRMLSQDLPPIAWPRDHSGSLPDSASPPYEEKKRDPRTTVIFFFRSVE